MSQNHLAKIRDNKPAKAYCTVCWPFRKSWNTSVSRPIPLLFKRMRYHVYLGPMTANSNVHCDKGLMGVNWPVLTCWGKAVLLFQELADKSLY